MPYKVAIRRNLDGLVRIHEDTLDWDDEEGSMVWFWTEGNYGCDCNRQLWFERAAGERHGKDIEGVTCGDTRYTCLYAELPGGERIPLDEEQPDSAKPEPSGSL